MARAAWSGTLGFGLVSIGVNLELAVRTKNVAFHLVHEADGGRIHEKYVCEKDGKEVAYKDLVKSYEVSKGRQVIVTRDELKALEPARDRTIAVEAFLELNEIDPVFFDRSYYVTPDGKGSERAYTLFADALEKTKRVALGRVVMSTKQHLCIVSAKDGLLRLNTMVFGDEVVEAPSAPHAKHSPQELQMATSLIDQLATPFKPAAYRDDHRAQVLALLEKKAKGKAIEAPEAEKPKAEGLGLAEALEASLKAAKSPSSSSRARPRRATGPAQKPRRSRHG